MSRSPYNHMITSLKGNSQLVDLEKAELHDLAGKVEVRISSETSKNVFLFHFY